MEEKKSSGLFSRSMMYAGAVVAYMVGSGFASGQECLQYYSCFGLWPMISALVVATLLYIWFSMVLMEDGRKLKLTDTNKIFRYYCGKKLGTVFEIFTAFFLYAMLAVMISGAGSILSEYYGIHQQVGRVGMAVIVAVTVLMGLDKILSVISKIGPIIIVFAIVVGVAGVILNPDGLANSAEVLDSIEIQYYATPHWLVSAINAPSLGMMMLVPFFAGLGPKAASRKEAVWGGFAGAMAFNLCVALVAFGVLANIGEVYDKAAPTLTITNMISPAIGSFFSIVLVIGIYSTSIPLLWVAANKIVPDEKDKRFKPVVLILSVVAFLVGQLPFAALMNILYPAAGYVAWIVMIGMLIKQIKTRKIMKETGDENALAPIPDDLFN